MIGRIALRVKAAADIAAVAVLVLIGRARVEGRRDDYVVKVGDLEGDE